MKQHPPATKLNLATPWSSSTTRTPTLIPKHRVSLNRPKTSTADTKVQPQLARKLVAHVLVYQATAEHAQRCRRGRVSFHSLDCRHWSRLRFLQSCGAIFSAISCFRFRRIDPSFRSVVCLAEISNALFAWVARSSASASLNFCMILVCMCIELIGTNVVALIVRVNVRVECSDEFYMLWSFNRLFLLSAMAGWSVDEVFFFGISRWEFVLEFIRGEFRFLHGGSSCVATKVFPRWAAERRVRDEVGGEESILYSVGCGTPVRRCDSSCVGRRWGRRGRLFSQKRCGLRRTSLACGRFRGPAGSVYCLSYQTCYVLVTIADRSVKLALTLKYFWASAKERTPSLIENQGFQNQNVIVFNSGEVRVEMRRFSLAYLRMLSDNNEGDLLQNVNWQCWVMVAGWEDVEDRLAEWFGLDQSKYQWAVDELLERQLVSWYSWGLVYATTCDKEIGVQKLCSWY